MTQYQSLVELLQERAESNKGITFIDNSKDQFVSYRQVYQRALQFLAYFQSIGLAPRQKVIILLNNNEWFLYSIWASMMGRQIPVPIAPGNNDEHRLKLFQIWKDLNYPPVITSYDVIGKMNDYLLESTDFPLLNLFKTKAVICGSEIFEMKSGAIVNSNLDDIAYVQYTSGTTGIPKGIALTHRNLFANLSGMAERCRITFDDSMLAWLPLSHDMGFSGTHLLPLFAGINQYNIPTALFIKRPTIWLEKATQYKNTITSSTTKGNKHYLTFLRKKREPAKLDLSRIRIIFNGAEVISASLCNEFLKELSQYGLSQKVIYPVYGMAEASLAVTFPIPGEGLKTINVNRRIFDKDWQVSLSNREDGIELVNVGYPIDGCQLRVVNEKNMDVPEDTVGKIQISGENVTKSIFYEGILTQTEEWVDTGDFGFVHENHMFFVGRNRDIVRINSNVYIMSDLERLGAKIGFDSERTIFCSVLSQIVVFILYKKELAEFIPLQNKIRDYYQNQLGLQIEYIIPIRYIPKTTSGKVQKYKLIQSLINGQFDDVIERLKGDEVFY